MTRMMRKLGTALLLAAACVLSRAAPLELFVEDAAEPFSNPDGSGYANDLVREAFRAVGVDVRFTVVPYARCKAYVINGMTPACFNMAREPALEGSVRFSLVPLYRVTALYFENTAHPLRAKNESELGAGVVVGVVNGYEYPQSAMQAQARGAQFAPARSEQINLKKLAVGRIDSALVMVNDLVGPDYWVREAGVFNQVVAAFPSSPQDVYIGFSIRHPRGRWAFDMFNLGHAKIIAAGVPKKLMEKWTGGKT